MQVTVAGSSTPFMTQCDRAAQRVLAARLSALLLSAALLAAPGTEARGSALPVGRFDATINRFKLQSDDPGLAYDIIVDFNVPAAPTKQPFMGDWDGSGTDTVGLYSPVERKVYLRNSNTSGPSEITYGFDPFGATCSDPIAIAGDWDGDDVVTPGLYCPGPASTTFYLRETNGPFDSYMSMTIDVAKCGAGGCIPVAGDWDADGVDTPGLYNRFTGEFYLARAIVMGSPYDTVTFTPPGFSNMQPLAGQWDRGRMDSVGLFDATTSTFHIAPSEVDPNEKTVQYGSSSDGVGLAGNWNGLLSQVPASSKWGVAFDGLIANSYPPGDLGRTLFYRMHEMGVGWVRLALYWDAIEPLPGQFDWSATDKAVKDITEAGLNIYGNPTWAPWWATTGDPTCPNYETNWCLTPGGAYDPTKCGCLDGPPPMSKDDEALVGLGAAQATHRTREGLEAAVRAIWNELDQVAHALDFGRNAGFSENTFFGLLVAIWRP